MKQEGHLSNPVWMPVWDDTELEELRSRRFPQLDSQLVRKALVMRLTWSCGTTLCLCGSPCRNGKFANY